MPYIFVILAVIAFQGYVTFCHSQKVGRGRVLTIPMRAFTIWAIMRSFSGLGYEEAARRRWFRTRISIVFVAANRPSEFRMLQIAVLICTLFTIFFLPWIVISYSVALSALYLDDLLTADDDLKKKWKALKNRFKWKWLPAPAAAT
jgi:hypothetical protein